MKESLPSTMAKRLEEKFLDATPNETNSSGACYVEEIDLNTAGKNFEVQQKGMNVKRCSPLQPREELVRKRTETLVMHW